LTGGALPPFWPRSAVFFANLFTLFFGNEAETQALRDEVGEIDSYGGRLVPILNLLFRGGDNVLVLEREPDAALCGYFRDDLGLTLPEFILMSRAQYDQLSRRLGTDGGAGADPLLAGLGRPGMSWIDGFVTDETLTMIAGALGKRTISSHRGSHRGNNKLLLHRFIESNGLPYIDTVVADTPHDVPGAARELSRRGYRDAVLKAQIGASGIGLMKMTDLSTAARTDGVPDHLFYEGACMLQGWLAPGVLGVTEVKSPSVQMFLDEDTVYLYDLTDQILDQDSVHQGNISPPTYLQTSPEVREEVLRQAGAVGGWLGSQGYRGTASVDFLLIERDYTPTPEVYVCEINARVTGATYPSVLARHYMPRGAWLLRNVRLSRPTTGDALLRGFRDRGHLWLPGGTDGVLPINFNFGPDGLVHKGQFLCLAPTTGQCDVLLDAVRRELGADSRYDRD
jgi:hypothetical protein